jgi:Transposase DDE domain
MLAHPSLTLLSPNFTRTDLFLVVYCLVDDWMKARFGSSNGPRLRRGPRPDEFSDAEVLTLLLVGELCHCRRERAWLRQVRASYRPLFPKLPEDSRFARRAERVRELLRQFRETVLFWADADLEPGRILDSFPMPLCACYRIRQSTLPITGATFGYNDRKRQYYYGLRPGLLMTLSGFVVDLILAPGNCNDTPLLAHYLDECVAVGRDLRGQTWVMDKGFRNGPLARWAQEQLGLILCARQHERRDDLPSSWQAKLDQIRKPVEGVLSVLTECFGIEHLLVKTDWGLYRRAQAKATAFTLARYFNRVLGWEPLNVARYAV